MASTSVGAGSLLSLTSVVNQLHNRLYWGIPVPQKPVTEKQVSKDERNQQICFRFAAGDQLGEIASEFDSSIQRVAQIKHRWC